MEATPLSKLCYCKLICLCPAQTGRICLNLRVDCCWMNGWDIWNGRLYEEAGAENWQHLEEGPF